MWIGDQCGVFLFVVMMRQGNAVGDLDAEGKAWWYRPCVFMYNVCFWQDRGIPFKQRPEPLVNLDGLKMLAVFLKKIYLIVPRINESPPGFVFPTAGSDFEKVFCVHFENNKISLCREQLCGLG